MKKRIITAVLMTALLAGCGKADEPERDRHASEEEEETEEEDEEEESDEKESGHDKPEAETGTGKEDRTAAGTSGSLQISITQEVSSRTDENGMLLFRGTYPHIILDTPGYDSLAETFDRMNVSYFNYVEDTANNFVTDWSDYIDTDSFAYGESMSTVDVCRADDAVVSLLDFDYTYLGGVHPNYVYMSNNFDPATGDKLSISDVLQDGQETHLAELIEADLLSRFEEDVFFSDISDAVEEVMGMAGLNFTLGYDSLTVYFSPYELAPYAYGGMVIDLPYADYPELVKDEYRETTVEDYITKVRSEDTIRLRDGRMIFYTRNWDGYNSIESITFTEDGKEQQFDVYAFATVMYVAYIGDKTYLYLDDERDNAAHFLQCIDISGAKYAEAEDEITGGFYSTPYNPDCVQLCTYSVMMSTSQVWQYRLVTPDGQIVPFDGTYYFIATDLDRKLTLKQDLTVEYREEFMGESEEIDLAAGNELYFYATDNETYVDFLLEGRGGYVRLYVNPEEWPQTIDGTDIEELFDGILFAG